MLDRLREPINGLTHLLAAVASAGGLVALLIIGRGDRGKLISLAIYGVSLILLFSASAAYHLTRAGPAAIQRLRKLDHSAIYLLIAGTYTPICYNLLQGFWQWGLLAILWGLAAIGIGVKLFFINTPRWLTAGIYVAMGWLGVLGAPEMERTLPAGALGWIVAGGLIYTLGAVVYITRRLDFAPGKFGFHEVWHIFVILGALAHFIAIAVHVAPA